MRRTPACCLVMMLGLMTGCGETPEEAPATAGMEPDVAVVAVEVPTRPEASQGSADIYEIFNVYMAPLNSSQVSQLQGGLMVVQSHRVAFRFRATATVIDALISQGYTPVMTAIPTGGMSGMQGGGVLPLVVPESAGMFSPAWNPDAIVNPERYERLSQHPQAGLMQSRLVIDRPNGLVYYTGQSQ
ncbi:hypothetical protein [Mucisphaera sp.]|uniref:hypothetical protein n=1 Tax=Mucisphaera sp. TaxID=2913024 RepID=UPI003D0FD1CF